MHWPRRHRGALTRSGSRRARTGLLRRAAAGLLPFSFATRWPSTAGSAGSESLLIQRNIAAHPTILSGDLNGDDAPGFIHNTENSYHVVTGSGPTATAALDGFIITGGNANGAALDNQRGGGIFCIGGSPTVRNCTLSSNYAAADGGGAHARLGSSPVFSSCTFSENVGPVRGGALYSFN